MTRGITTIQTEEKAREAAGGAIVLPSAEW
jgi:hypothetical protein